MTENEYIEKSVQFAKGTIELAFRMGYVTRDSEIVRCKDCKHWQKSSINYNEYVCYWGGYIKQEDDYCSWAERREEC